jgi:hypothetical protein
MSSDTWNHLLEQSRLVAEAKAIASGRSGASPREIAGELELAGVRWGALESENIFQRIESYARGEIGYSELASFLGNSP